MTSAPTFDLQSHSTYSDGALAPADVVASAAAAGVELLALTDHDNTAGVPEAQRAAQAAGIGLVPAVEMTATHGEHHDLHVLGYLVDPGEPALTAALQRSRGDRERRVRTMAATLRELGFSLDEQLLDARSADGLAIGRPHLAEAVVRHPANHERLREAGLREPTAFLVAYLVEGAPAFVARRGPPVAEAIALIHGAGGVAVWAHPFWDVDAHEEVRATIAAFHADGLDGVEAFYPSYDEAQTRLLVQECARRDLLTTGSSDFHGPQHGTFSRFRAFHTFGMTPNLGPLAR